MNKRMITALFLLCIFFTPAIIAQQQAAPETTASATPTQSPQDQITEKSVKTIKEELVTKIETAKKTLETATVAGATEIIQAKIQIFERHDLILSQLLTGLQQRSAQQTGRTQLEEQKERYKTEGPEGEKPFSYLFYDNLRTQLKEQNEKTAAFDSSIEAAQTALDQAKSRLNEAESARRNSNDQLANDSSPLAQLKHDNLLLEAEGWQDTVRLRQLELDNLKTEKENHLESAALLEQKTKDISLDVRFRETDLNEQLTKIDGQVRDLEKQKNDAESYQNTRVIPELNKASTDHARDNTTLSNEKLNLAIMKRNLYQEKVSVLEKRLNRTQNRKTFWEKRHKTVNGLTGFSEMQAWKKENADVLSAFQTEENITKNEITAKQTTFNSVDANSESYQDNPALRAVFEEQKKIINEHISALQSNISSINATRSVIVKLEEEINKELNLWTWEEVLAYSWQVAKMFFDRELYHYVDDNGAEANITFGEITIALSIFIFGWFLARLFSKFLGFILMNRFSVEEGVVVTIRSLFFYFVVAMLVPISLKVVSVDLTAFAFLGGALAIAVGFGSQNIFSNFISGIIMLVERPVRVGDIVEVEGVSGKITQIGLRSTLLNTWDNQDIVIPNNYFLENRVTNFTLENWINRSNLSVGVAYGSDTRLVQKLIRKAIDEHGLILKFPEPIVIFSNFGENSLDFTAYFWVDMKNCNRLEVNSDIRHRINKMFIENHIEIPFPQRDLHFRSNHPLDVRIVPPEQ